ncbi:MAG TPA: GerMN domain-containing protein [Coleofasciculaceae cyanobacterium]
MPSIGKSTLLSFSLLLIIGGISAGGSQAINAISSPTLLPLAESSTKQTETLSNSGQILSQQTHLTKQASPTVSAQAPATLKKVQVFFPRNPKSNSDFTYVESVLRTTSNPSIAQFAIEQLISGPTNQEKARGFVGPIKFRGSSNCGKDFTLSTTNGIARLKFCKSVVSAGTGDDGRQISSINATLKQFSTIKSVIILDRNGNCLGDQSGDNPCLKKAQNQEKLTEASQLSLNRIGPVNFGMTLTEASGAAGVPIVPLSSTPNRVCDYYKPASGLSGVSFMVAKGQISRVDIESNRITTIHGAKIGDTEAKIKSLYPNQIQVSRLANSEKGNILTVIPERWSDSNFRIMFETDGQQVRRIKAGKLPEVGYIEGCLDVRPG